MEVKGALDSTRFASARCRRILHRYTHCSTTLCTACGRPKQTSSKINMRLPAPSIFAICFDARSTWHMSMGMVEPKKRNSASGSRFATEMRPALPKLFAVHMEYIVNLKFQRH